MVWTVARHARFASGRSLFLALCASGLLAACGDSLDGASATINNGSGSGNGSIGGNGTASSSGGAQTSYTVGGTTIGLSGTGLVLQDNAGNDLTITGNGGFSFPNRVAGGTTYVVTVKVQPATPTQLCSVMNGVGTVGTVNVASIVVSCTTDFYTLNATVIGLAGSGLVLQTNGSNNVPIASPGSGSYVLATLASGAPYTVTVMTQPSNPAQTCTIANDTGTVTTTNVTNIAVSCTTNQYALSGSVTGLTGSGLVLQTNGGNSVPAAGNGSYTLATLPSGSAYAVTVLTQPAAPAQWCMVGHASGTVSSADLSNVSVICRNTGRFVFVTNTNDGPNGSISAFSINTATGALTAIAGTPFTTVDLQPNGIALDASGNYAYVANINSADIVTYAIAASGALSVFGTISTGVAGTDFPSSLAMDPAGTYLYLGSDVAGANGTIAVFAVNAGVLAAIGAPYASGDTPLQLVVDPADQFLYAANVFDGNVAGFTIGAGGALAALAGSPVAFQNGQPANGPYGLAVYPGGQFLYISDYVGNTVTAYGYDASGVLTELGAPLPTGAQPESIAVDPSGRFLYVANSGDGTLTAFGIIPSAGTLTLIGSVPTSGVLSGASTAVSVDPSGQFVYVGNGDTPSVSAFSINQLSGGLSLIGSYPTGSGSQNLAIK
jgi:6-phosphogluconolactonase (cycloisomerase 2 family)